MSANSLSITDAVRRQYEAHPFPNYSLWLPIRWQEAYASTAIFAAQLLREHQLVPALDRSSQVQILMAGCGDMFPSLLAHWEPRAHQLHAIDLSHHNIRRARLRVLAQARRVNFSQGNLEEQGLLPADCFAHIDVYGVLHHLANPKQTLSLLAQSLQAGGTMRIMVYNNHARNWIQHLQRAFQLLDLNHLDAVDVRQAQKVLELLDLHIPALRAKIEPLRASILRQKSRLVDTFLHAREAKLDIAFWWDAIAASGLTTVGLFDRYGELDDLANPLYQMPTLDQLELRALDRRYENNLELFCMKAGETPNPPSVQPLRIPMGLYRRSPPSLWKAYQETKGLGMKQSWQIWQSFRQSIYRRQAPSLDPYLSSLAAPCLQRLARLGALWPSSLADFELRSSLQKPIHSFMEAPEPIAVRDPKTVPGLIKLLEQILIAKKRSLALNELILQRIIAAQKMQLGKN